MTDREMIKESIIRAVRNGAKNEELRLIIDKLLEEQEPVAHAAWLGKETSTAYDLYGVKTWAARYKCSKCGFVHRAIEAHMSYSYCPSCGARMDEVIKEGEVYA